MSPPPGGEQRLEQLDHERPHARLELAHPLRREVRLQQTAEARVVGPVGLERDPRTRRSRGLSAFENVSVSRATPTTSS